MSYVAGLGLELVTLDWSDYKSIYPLCYHAWPLNMGNNKMIGQNNVKDPRPGKSVLSFLNKSLQIHNWDLYMKTSISFYIDITCSVNMFCKQYFVCLFLCDWWLLSVEIVQCLFVTFQSCSLLNLYFLFMLFCFLCPLMFCKRILHIMCQWKVQLNSNVTCHVFVWFAVYSPSTQLQSCWAVS